MKRRLAYFLFVAFALTYGPHPASARDRSPFSTLSYSGNRQFTLSCAARYECDIALEAGERVNDGFNAHIDQWDPHVGYSGDHQLTPHLVLRPARAGLRTNIILTTTKRTYYLLVFSTAKSQPSYYSFTYDDAQKAMAKLALAALRTDGPPAPVPTPANAANLASTCIDYNYSYLVDRNVQSDHAPHAKPSTETLPASLVPKLVCSDGKHTFVEFPIQREVPSDLPISLAVTSEGDTLINYTYAASLNRFTVDGVYDSFVLELGSQNAPLRLRIFHAGRGNPPSGRNDPKPIPITTPAAGLAQAAVVPAAVVPSAVVPSANAAPTASPAPVRPAPRKKSHS